MKSKKIMHGMDVEHGTFKPLNTVGNLAIVLDLNYLSVERGDDGKLMVLGLGFVDGGYTIDLTQDLKLAIAYVEELKIKYGMTRSHTRKQLALLAAK